MTRTPPAAGPDGASAESLKLRSVLYDRATGLPTYPLLFDRLREELDRRRHLGVLHVEIADLELVESLYGWQVFDRPKDRKPVIAQEANGPFPDDVHFENFVQSIRSRKLPNADIEEGHRSTLLCQLANISYRLGGRKLTVDAATETLVDDGEANRLLKREYRAPWVVPDFV